jgi:ribose transport system substrate-binding protein
LAQVFFAAIGVASLVQTAPAADQKPTIPMIVKDTTTFYWQIVLAGARKAGKDLNVSVPQFGAQSESDSNGQISILENAVSEKPAAIVIAPTQFKALGKPIDDAAKKVKIIGIDSAADSKAFTSFLTTDNVQGGRVAADALALAHGHRSAGVQNWCGMLVARVLKNSQLTCGKKHATDRTQESLKTGI